MLLSGPLPHTPPSLCLPLCSNSRIEAALSPGTEYIVIVMGRAGADGAYVLSITEHGGVAAS